MIDSEDRRVLAQVATILILGVLSIIVFAAACGIAVNVFEAARRF
jgi:hypothetical protein